MNILSINSFNITNPKPVTPRENKFGLIMAKPLSKDTVSFGTTNKMLVKRGNGVTLETGRRINAIAEEIQPEIERFMKGLFSKYMGTLIKFIGGRAKKPKSIVEKSDVLGVTSLNDAFHTITDLNATKAVMVVGTRKDTHKVLNILLDAIQRGFLILEEVEVKRPKAAEKLKGQEASKWDYADPEKLEQFVSEAETAMGKKVKFDPLKPDYTPANYTAIHFLFRLPGQKKVFEFQLMGPNVAIFKDLDDILYKILNNKEVDPKFQPIVDILNTISLNKGEKNILKYLKINERLQKLGFSEADMIILKNRVLMEKSILDKSDPPEYINRVKSLLRSKDIKEEDLSLLNDPIQYDAEELDKETVKKLKQKADMQEKFKAYRAQAFLFQREKKNIQADDEMEYFLPLTEELPSEFDLNNLYKIYLERKKLPSKK